MTSQNKVSSYVHVCHRPLISVTFMTGQFDLYPAIILKPVDRDREMNRAENPIANV